jgi:hypothetical protein
MTYRTACQTIELLAISIGNSTDPFAIDAHLQLPLPETIPHQPVRTVLAQRIFSWLENHQL